MEVLTHGLALRPRSLAFLASMAAAIMTDGLEVLVQDVIEAIATWPWSMSKVPLSVVTETLCEGREDPLPSLAGWVPPLSVSLVWDGASEAGNDPPEDPFPSSCLT